ncbi:AAA family ATPase [Streptomyces sp. NBC_00322]|uniref:ATP-binding protein n=1 Tax=Streptomyces sp. NBC_00322 TaxID=2975712 RepID=UPI002E2CC420|nr:AAA family ATPase [Streptomyces sp. NBC_00322]
MWIGREGHIGTLRALLDEAIAGRGGSALVEGEPGAGRTRLLKEALPTADEPGCRIRHGSGDELWQGYPLRAVLDCLYGDDFLYGDGFAADTGRSEIVALLNGERAEATTAEASLMAAMDRLLAVVDELCAERPLVLVLDDLQWADDASLLMWQRLSKAAPRLPLLLVASCRPVPRRRELDRLRAGLVERGTLPLFLGPLTPEETDRFAESLVGAPLGPRLRGRVALAGGNPRYIADLVTGLLAKGAVDRDGGRAELTVPPGESGHLSALAERIGFLSPTSYETLRQAALLGTEFDIGQLALVLGRTTRQLLEDLDEPLAAGLLSDTGDRLRFRHEVVHEALYAGVPASVRSALHLDAARALLDAGAPPPVVAGQLRAVPGPMTGWAVHWLVEHAGALNSQSPVLAAELIERAIEQGEPSDADRPVLEERLAEAATLLRRPESAGLVRILRDRAQDPARRVVLGFMLTSALMVQGDMAQALKATEEALAEPGLCAVWHIRLVACRVLCHTDLDRLEAARTEGEATVAAAQRLGDPLAEAEARHAMSYVYYRLGREREALDQVAQGIARARQAPAAGDIRLLMLANLAEGHVKFHRTEDAEKTLEEARTLARLTGSTGRLVGIEARCADLKFRTGRWDRAAEHLEQAAALKVSDAWVPVLVHGMHALILGHQDQRAAAVAHLELVEPDALGVGTAARREAVPLLLARALLAERDGRPHDALRVLLPILSEEYAADMVHERHRLFPDLVRLGLESGDIASAEAALAACEAEAARSHEAPGPATAAIRCRGLFAQDPALLSQAVANYERGSRPLLLGLTLEDLAVALAWHGDLAAARAGLDRAVEAYEALGARWDIARAEARLRTLGVRRGSRTTRRRATSGWESLTPAELKVALLVAEGRSNPEIATELFLSRRTVQTHVSHILGKLQLRSRTEVARKAALRAAGE